MLRLAVSFVALAAACGDDGNTVKDGGKDGSGTPQDIGTTDIDNASCGNMTRFTGELVDWETDATFCGIFEANFEVQGGGAMDTTAPNGRFDLCIPDQEQTIIDVTPPVDPSQCTAGSYVRQGIVVAKREVIFAQGGIFSGRLFTSVREETFFTEIGQGFEEGKAHLFVHVAGTPRPLTLAAAHGPTMAIIDKTWAKGDTGHEVFFPNIEVPVAGTTMLGVTGGVSVGAGSIPLAPGKITSVTIVVN